MFNDSTADCHTVVDLKEMIETGNYDVHISDDIDVKVKGARLVKKLIKGTLNEEGYATIYDDVALSAISVK